MQIFARPHYTKQRYGVTGSATGYRVHPKSEESFMDTVNFLIVLVSGAVGGNAAGAALKEQSFGTIGNSMAGVLGGGIGGAILQTMGVGMGSGGADLGALGGQVFAGGVGGGFLMVLIALIRGAVAKT